MGRASDPQRAGHAWHRGGRLHSGEVDASETQAAFADVARLPGQPPPGPGGDRFLRGAYGHLPDPGRLHRLGTHDRRRVVHFNVTAHPTAEWTARRVVQAFPEEAAPRFLLRDRDKVYGERFQQVIDGLGIGEVVTAARSPWQNPYAERLIGSLRRDCLDHVIVLDEVHLRRCWQGTSGTTTGVAATSRWMATARSLGPSRDQSWAGWSCSPRWADSTIDTSEWRRDRRTRDREGVRMAFSATTGPARGSRP